jgi:hypothetical protein
MQNNRSNAQRGKQADASRAGELIGTAHQLVRHRGWKYWDVLCLRCGTMWARSTGEFSQLRNTSGCKGCTHKSPVEAAQMRDRSLCATGELGNADQVQGAASMDGKESSRDGQRMVEGNPERGAFARATAREAHP